MLFFLMTLFSNITFVKYKEEKKSNNEGKIKLINSKDSESGSNNLDSGSSKYTIETIKKNIIV